MLDDVLWVFFDASILTHLGREILWELLQLFKSFQEDIVEIFNDYFIIASIIDHVLFAVLNDAYQLVVLGLILAFFQSQGIMLKQLKQKSPVKAIAVSSQPTNMLKSSTTSFLRQYELLEAGLKLRPRILGHNNNSLKKFRYKRHLVAYILFNLVLIICI